ncbi:hypothetical protein QZJ86_16535 [Methylomonas montana]|uniref:hypothetical protein n=1 Tax=Methylomonas montana TaxID=3058963 RepID=UPI0026597C1D|nr:hypothetical protein [Methylomonas montana]WKJ89610.1 hypothetical protein QZJ86_16535 [Methylomonas montana]
MPGIRFAMNAAVDYAVFFQMADSDEASNNTALAVTLSAFTILLTYGLLAASDTSIVHAFAVTLAKGIFSTFFLAQLIGCRWL